MATLKVSISTSKSADTMTQQYLRPVSSKYADCQAIADLVQGVISGREKGVTGSPPSVVAYVEQEATRASGTFTLTSVVATDASSINGVTFTAVASGATGNQFNVGANDTETAVNLAASINASVTALVAGYVTATSATTVVTVYSTDYGIQGNQTLIASADATIVASGARLTGGAVDSNAKTYTF